MVGINDQVIVGQGLHPVILVLEVKQAVVFLKGPKEGETVDPVVFAPGITFSQGAGAIYLENDGIILYKAYYTGIQGVESGGFWRCGLALNACTEVHGPATPGFLYMMTSLAVVDYDDPRRDHDIMALYRYYDPITGPRNVLRLLHLEGDTLTFISDMVKITPPLPVDNFEGVAAIKTAAGYRIFLISDSLKEDGKPKLLIFDWTP